MAQSSRGGAEIEPRLTVRLAEEAAAAERPAAPAEPAAAPASAGPSLDAMDQLKQLGELHEQGVLTDEECAAQKAKLLG